MRLTGNPFQWAAQNVAWGRVYRSLDSVVTDRIGFISTYGLYGYASTQTLDFFYLLTVLFALGAVWPVYRRFGIRLRGDAHCQRPAADCRRRTAFDGTSDIDLVPGIPVDGRRGSAAASARMDRDLRGAAGICRRHVFHVATVVLIRVLSVQSQSSVSASDPESLLSTSKILTTASRWVKSGVESGRASEY